MADLASIVAPEASAWERDLDLVAAERWAALDPDVIRRFKDPWQCPPHLLAWLAHERSVDIWDETWPELKKRSVIASAPADHRIKGTLAGTRRYVEIAGGHLRQVVRPPQGTFAGRSLTKMEMDAHIALHPKVRITLARGKSVGLTMDGCFAGDAVAGESCASIDDGPALYGRRAYLVENGVQRPLQLQRLIDEATVRTGKVVERIHIPGYAAGESFAGEIGANVGFADAWDVAPQHYTVVLDRSYVHAGSRLELSLATVGYIPRDIRYRRESGIGAAGDFAFTDGFAGEVFAGWNDAPELLADVLHLFDPAIASPMEAGGSFADHDRVDMPAHSADLLVDLMDRDHGPSHYAGHVFDGEGFAAPEDMQRQDFMLDAVASSKRLSDKLGVSFQLNRPRTLADGLPLDGSHRFGDVVPFSL